MKNTDGKSEHYAKLKNLNNRGISKLKKYSVGGKRHLWGHWDPFYGWWVWGCVKSGSGGQHTNRLPRFGPRRCIKP